MTKTFKTKRITGVHHDAIGAGTFTVPVNFVPDFVKIEFLGGKASKKDDFQWELAMVTPSTFTLTVHYLCEFPRHIRYVVAKLPVDPEATIAF